MRRGAEAETKSPIPLYKGGLDRGFATPTPTLTAHASPNTLPLVSNLA